MGLDLEPLHAAYAKVRADLLAQRTQGGYWVGQLSSSALSTATAVSALALAASAPADGPSPSGAEQDARHVQRGLQWLRPMQNPDGGWGDTDRSHSNIATTMLVVAAVHLAGQESAWNESLERAQKYIDDQGRLQGLRRRYGKDRTFAAPILTNYALANRVDWSDVPALPFEAAWVPQRLYHWMQLPVVSYAIPALVAIGQVRFFHHKPKFALTRWIRSAAVEPTLRVLERMQPESGGYLEAVPLTSFVVMSLASIGRGAGHVVQAGLRFLRDSVRPDGSWPIDTNLATWNTTLALNALAGAGEDIVGQADLGWLLGCQHDQRHPYTGAAPGGWGWSDLSGAVPDADDTAGALLALGHWYRSPSCRQADRGRIEQAASQAVHWLCGLQNADGGWPTFCRGWGRLPFDRSGADLTAHALRALQLWPVSPARRHAAVLGRGWQYLRRVQREDGSWAALWFGNQDHPSEENPVYGTAKVLLAQGQLGRSDTSAAQRGLEWLVSVQSGDGGWSGAVGGPPSVEETSLAVEALVVCSRQPGIETVSVHAALQKGINWLNEMILADRHRESSPIGFYFAKLWYYERLYPLTFAVAALGQAVRQFGNPSTHH